MTRPLDHIVPKRSWWDGSGTTLCGIRFEPGQSESSPLFLNKCPACVRIKKKGRR